VGRSSLQRCTTGSSQLSEPDLTETPSAAAAARRVDTDDPGGVFVVRGLYVLPRDGLDRRLAEDGTLARSVSAMQSWLYEQTGSRLRFLAEKVPTVRLAETDAQIAARGDFVRDRVETLLRRAGFHDPRALYAVWYDGSSTTSCGGGAWPPQLKGHVAALYLQGAYDDVNCAADAFTGDGVQPAINEFKMLHEILHTMGFVPRSAPHHTRDGHTGDDETDLMYAGDGVWNPSVIDAAHDDYYLTGRTGTPDLSRSCFLEPLPPNAEAPPGW
jgi:hypothetical protein